MKTLIVSALCLTTGGVLAGEKVDKSLDAATDGVIEVEVVRGEVTIEGWDKNVVQVVGTLDDRSEKLIFERSGKNIRIEDDVPNNLRSGEGSKLTIKVPRQSSLNVDVVSADLNVSQVKGKSELSTVSGDLRATDLGDEVELKSVSGDVKLKGAGKILTIGSVSGDVHADVSAERINGETVSGDLIIASAGRVSRANLESVSGDIKLDAALADDVELDAETVSGDITITAMGAVNARLRIETGPGGDITNRLTNDKPSRSFINSNSLDVKVGSGRGQFKMETVSGDITLQKK